MVIDEEFDADEILRDKFEENPEAILDEENIDEVDFERGHGRLLEDQFDDSDDY